MDEALLQYRVAAQVNPNSPQLWNNIGMVFFSKQQHVGALACLKKALYLVGRARFLLYFFFPFFFLRSSAFLIEKYMYDQSDMI